MLSSVSLNQGTSHYWCVQAMKLTPPPSFLGTMMANRLKRTYRINNHLSTIRLWWIWILYTCVLWSQLTSQFSFSADDTCETYFLIRIRGNNTSWGQSQSIDRRSIGAALLKLFGGLPEDMLTLWNLAIGGMPNLLSRLIMRGWLLNQQLEALFNSFNNVADSRRAHGSIVNALNCFVLTLVPAVYNDGPPSPHPLIAVGRVLHLEIWNACPPSFSFARDWVELQFHIFSLEGNRISSTLASIPSRYVCSLPRDIHAFNVRLQKMMTATQNSCQEPPAIGLWHS
jgi:hypothetical protein